MGKLFDIVKNEIQLTPEVLAVPALYKLWERDKSRNKITAKKELTYVVFLCDFKSPYKDIPYEEKDKIIRSDIFGKRSSWEPDVLVKEALDKYKQLQKTRHMRLLESTFKTEEEITKYFNNIDMTKLDDFGKPIYTMDSIIKNMEKVGSVIKSLTTLEKQVQSEILELSARGGSEIGYYENPSSVRDVKSK